MQLKSVVINTTHVARASSFWMELLDLEVARSSGDSFTWLTPVGDTGVSLAFQQVGDPPEGRRRLHLDFAVDDVDATTRRVVELGGSQVKEHTVGNFTWRVMADRDGNEFCLAEDH